MRSDPSSADIQVEDANGNAVPVPAGSIRDGNGTPITTLDVAVKFDDRRTPRPLHRASQRICMLDFNLRASNTAATSRPVHRWRPLGPFLVADVDPRNPNTMRFAARSNQ